MWWPERREAPIVGNARTYARCGSPCGRAGFPETGALVIGRRAGVLDRTFVRLDRAVVY
jgi:hypothetical protein